MKTKNIVDDKSRQWMQPIPEVVAGTRTTVFSRLPRLRSAFMRVRLHGMFGVWDLFRLRSYFSLKTFVRLRFDLRNWQVSELVMPAELRIEHGRLEDLQRFRNRMSTAVFPDDFLADQIFGLSQFYLGLWGEEIAHILWVARSGETCSVSNLRLQSDAVEFRNVHTLERFRRRQIFGHVLRTALHDLRMAGVGTGFAHVNEHNLAS